MFKKYTLFLLLTITWSITQAQDISFLEKKAENATNWQTKLDIYIEIMDTLLWVQNNDKFPNFQNAMEQANAICANNDCGEKQLLIQLFQHLIPIVSEPDRMNFIHTTLKNHSFKNPLIKARFLERTDNLSQLTEAETIYKKYTPHSKQVYFVYYEMYYVHAYNSKIDSAFIFIEKVHHLAKKNNDINYTLKALQELAILNRTQGDMEKTTALFLEIIEITQKHFKGSYRDYRAQHDLLHLNKNEKQAIAKSYQIIEELNQEDKLFPPEKDVTYINSYRIIAKNYLKLNQPKKALNVIDTALTNYCEIETSAIPCLRLKLIKVDVYLELKEYQAIENLLAQALDETTSRLPFSIRLDVLKYYYRLYLHTQTIPQQVLFKLEPIIEEVIARNQGEYNVANAIAHKLAVLLVTQRGDKNEIFKAIHKAEIIEDSLNQQENARLADELLVKYQTKEKEQQLEVQKLELAQKTSQRNFLIGAALAFLLLGGLSVWYFRNRNQLLQKDLESKQIIEQQAAELQQLYDSKNRFFANIAHELRTPLTLIASPVAHMIQNKNLPNTIQQSLGIVHRNTTYLKQLVNQILDLSKKETGVLPVQIHQFQFGDLLKALVADFTPFADYQQIAFQIPNNLNNQIQLKTDGEKLFIILKNLLSNAFKYTNTYGQVSLTYVDMGETLQISVQDTGRGISIADLPNVFKRYFQTNDVNAPIEGGTGIGLALSKEYIESLQGSINVNSELGKGSSFVVTLPKKLKTSTTLSTAPLSFLEQPKIETISLLKPSTSNTERNTLLIVEDNLDICQHLQIILQNKYQLIFAHNGVEALKQLENNTPELILTDLMMPIMDGFELIEKLKKDEKYEDIPIITLTARSEMADKLTALRIGVDDYLVKPFHEEELALRIQYLLENQEKRKQFAQEEDEIASMQSDVEAEPTSTPTLSTDEKEWLEELETLVKNRIGDVNFGVNQLPLEMASSPSKIYRMTKRLTGLTPKQYINQIRYAKARKLLEQNTYQSVKRVAYEVGFKDERHFSRNFKKRFGRYPSEY